MNFALVSPSGTILATAPTAEALEASELRPGATIRPMTAEERTAESARFEANRGARETAGCHRERPRGHRDLDRAASRARGLAKANATRQSAPVPIAKTSKGPRGRALTFDLTGRTFGDLTVIGRAPRRADGRVWWTCRTSAGLQVERRSDHLREGRDTSVKRPRVERADEDLLKMIGPRRRPVPLWLQALVDRAWTKLGERLGVRNGWALRRSSRPEIVRGRIAMAVELHERIAADFDRPMLFARALGVSYDSVRLWVVKGQRKERAA